MMTEALVLMAPRSGAQVSSPLPVDQLLPRLAIESAGNAPAPPIEIRIDGGKQSSTFETVGGPKVLPTPFIR
jgi:hypothetical protein